MFLHRPSRLVLPAAIRDRIAAAVAAAHPAETGGYLLAEQRDGALYATEHIHLDNQADDPRRRFVADVDRDSLPTPRVFYHSHTSPATPSGLTGIDRSGIPDPLALVVFAPREEPYSYRLFRRRLFNWREMPVESPGDATLPKL